MSSYVTAIFIYFGVATGTLRGVMLKMAKTWPASFVVALWLIGPAITVSAVSPLVTDDADTVPAGQLQINSDFTFTERTRRSCIRPPLTPRRLTSLSRTRRSFRVSMAAGPGPASTTGDANSVTDLTSHPNSDLKKSCRGNSNSALTIDLTFPTASDRHGLGTVNVDAGSIGYRDLHRRKYCVSILMSATTPSILPEQISRDDRWFIGQAVRRALNKNWSVFAEAYALLPKTGEGGQATFYFSGGPQWVVTKNVAICAFDRHRRRS